MLAIFYHPKIWELQITSYIVKSRFGIVVIATISDGVGIGDGVTCAGSDSAFAPRIVRIRNNGSAGSVENSYNVTLQIFHIIIIPDFLSFVKDAATPSIIVPLPYQISNMPLH